MTDRRTVLKGCAASIVALSTPSIRARAEGAAFEPTPGPWRSFEIKTRIDIPPGRGPGRVWAPAPGFDGPGWMKAGETTFDGDASAAEFVHGPAAMVSASWSGDGDARWLEVKSRVSTRDRSSQGQGRDATLSESERSRYVAATDHIPLDGIVAERSAEIVGRSSDPREKAKLIYEWVVENTFRDAKVRGCGLGDVRTMLERGNLGGKCADINALYVGLARAAGLPARDVYGIRVAPSRFGYKSLGAKSEIITSAQHCRAEVWLDGAGWTPVDPADVRKVALEEPPGNLGLTNTKVAAARKTLFGSWETNWLAYNDAQDVALPGSDGPVLAFLMYPQAEFASGRVDCLDPENFRYSITTREITA